MHIHKEGTVSITLVLLLFIIDAIVLAFTPLNFVSKLVIYLPFFALILLMLWFFRIPDRVALQDDLLVIAPADGKIVVIEKTIEQEYFKDERVQVSIFMSPLNVHQNVYPIAGTVKYTQHHKGKYLVAWHPKSSLLNERSTVVIKHSGGTEILVRQIAGAVARRICTYSKVGEKVNQCDELGFIKFGSRVDLFLPLTAKIECKVGQTAINKITSIGRLS